MSLGIANIYMYVNPATQMAEKLVSFALFGATERVNSEWVPTTRATSGIDDLTDYKVYLLDWDTDFLPMDAEDDGLEHKAVQLFDEGKLTEDACKEYGKLLRGPSQEKNVELEAAIERFNNQQGK
jgi:hypothetical protein